MEKYLSQAKSFYAEFTGQKQHYEIPVPKGQRYTVRNIFLRRIGMTGPEGLAQISELIYKSQGNGNPDQLLFEKYYQVSKPADSVFPHDYPVFHVVGSDDHDEILRFQVDEGYWKGTGSALLHVSGEWQKRIPV